MALRHCCVLLSYRLHGQSRITALLKVVPDIADNPLRPAFIRLEDVRTAYPSDVTEQIICEELFKNTAAIGDG